MSVKVSGKEWKRFYEDDSAWFGNAYHDDVQITIDGIDGNDVPDLGKIDDNAKVVLSGGLFFPNDAVETKPLDLVAVFKKWLARQKMSAVVVDIPKDKIDVLKEFLKQIGGKLV